MENKDKPDGETLRGRPKKEKEKLSCSINLKLSEKDFKSVKEKAGKLGMKATQYARGMVLKGSVKLRFSLEDLDLMRKLSGMANNLNQIARQANKSGLINTAMEVISITTRIKKLLDDR
ncbi:MAG TPA: MobC family plasmid mobilization relaxosome protein [Dysgonomonas sp.]|uniref:MobC family plasmid mobilization relaxosome protein n=1 Tax=unclassified Dysgonomonas TaxID=2630389 RepID=UPI0025BEB785|nr:MULTISPECIES: MobC family plasmid mobilization relaxosome protein [unclassified Dysgonomonas]HML65974.1 MobC family plasmid mobilization relaxosome protein [Dysgonomonas sp.]